ncbi:helix-turn-helix domain-containing protein [Hyphococcus sp.]|uniref:helix-turn-helix domain-containing protein n=1 Tax=Hyphococcus sp. TaxID=2038636 RepID=UPI00207EBC4E|nr:MAG: hypothetical protein DHS20C04_31140 [Marinicaulis sp.]
MANNINSLRVAFLLDTRDFAKLIGIYPEYVRRLESGDRPLTELWIDAVAHALDIPAEAVTNTNVNIAELTKQSRHQPPPPQSVLCPVAARYVILSLVARLGGLKTANSLDEDELADAVRSLVSFVEEGLAERVNDEGVKVASNRLSKGLQLTVLTILQSRAPDLPADLELMLEHLAPGAVSLLEAYSAVAAPARVWES